MSLFMSLFSCHRTLWYACLPPEVLRSRTPTCRHVSDALQNSCSVDESSRSFWVPSGSLPVGVHVDVSSVAHVCLKVRLFVACSMLVRFRMTATCMAQMITAWDANAGLGLGHDARLSLGRRRQPQHGSCRPSARPPRLDEDGAALSCVGFPSHDALGAFGMREPQRRARPVTRQPGCKRFLARAPMRGVAMRHDQSSSASLIHVHLRCRPTASAQWCWRLPDERIVVAESQQRLGRDGAIEDRRPLPRGTPYWLPPPWARGARAGGAWCTKPFWRIDR